MAKYGISVEGVASLNQLAQDMSTINDAIETDGKKLKSTVEGLDEGLGIYGDKILELVDSVNITQETGRESVEQLISSVRKLAQNVQDLVSAGLG